MKTMRAAHLGAKLRELRETAQLKPQEAADKLGWNVRRLYRVEAGENVIKPADLVAAMDLYNADIKTRGALGELRKEARAVRRGWWVGFGDVFRSSLPALEHEAHRMRMFETTLIPGLFQTPEYARAVFTAMRPQDTSESITRRVQARMARQALITRENPPDLHVILDEAALLRQVGGPKVMETQISALWTVSHRPNVTLQILPLDSGAHAGMDGPFMILNFSESAYSEVAHIEGQGGDVYLEGARDLERISLAWDRLAMAALTPDDSARRCAELTRK